MERLEAAELFAFDTETTSLDYMQARARGPVLRRRAGTCGLCPRAHDYPGRPDQLERDWVLRR